MFGIAELIELLPDSVKVDIIDITPVKLKDGGTAERVILDRLLTEYEKTEMIRTDRILGVDCIAHCRTVLELQTSYFYIRY